jgi:hypothetical protein
MIADTAFSWLPGSDEWELALPGGDFYNSTGVIPAWEMAAGGEYLIDLSGLMLTEYFDYTGEIWKSLQIY